MAPPGRAAAVALLCGASLGVAAGCGQDCCTIDSFPIALARAPVGGAFSAPPAASDGGASTDAGALPDAGALIALAAAPGAGPGQAFPWVVDTASPITILSGPAGSQLETIRAGFDLFDANATGQAAALRARFRDLDLLRFPLQAVGGAAEIPRGILGGDLLRAFSVEFRFGALCAGGSSALCSSMTFWNHQGADASFLEDAGYAVLNFALYGGGEVTANGDPDFLGLRGPLELQATRVVLRTCAIPEQFTPAPPVGQTATLPPKCCTAAEAATLSSGVDLSLLVDTGVAPLVLAASAWQRVVAAAAKLMVPASLPSVPATPPVPAPPPLLVASWPTPIGVLLWATIPRFALVNLEIGTNDDPGPCVELGRSRRAEIVSYDTVMFPELGVCTEPCDLDPNASSEALNTAAYLEIGGQIPVAVIADDEPFLQGLRFDVLPEGPELDGLLGAAALGRARVELDYLSQPPRAIFSCEADASRDACWAAARCPRLPNSGDQHYCFGLPEHGLAPACAPSGC